VSHVNAVTLIIVVLLFLLVTVTGFAAARWRRTEDMMHLNEWGLGGRGFGTFVSWFLLGGDTYTAYTFIAVPAAVYAAGAADSGLYAVSYTIMSYPIAIIFLPRLWSICRVHNYVTPADFIRGRYGSRGLALAVAFTGILALMPYIALQLVGIQSVITVMGLGASSNNTFVQDLPLFIAFLVLAVFTYVSGLRAPALISFVKDALVYIMVIAAIVYIPIRLGGWGHIFTVADAHLKAINPKTGKANGLFIPTTGDSQISFATLALGSACALFVYPHTITGTIASKRRYVVKRNMSLLPIYSILLGLIALLGYMALADKTTVANVKGPGKDNTQLAVPYLFQHLFPSWFVGVVFAAIIIGALVPAAIMAIAAANLFTRNIFKEFFKPDASPKLQTRVSQWVSLVAKIGGLLFAIELPREFSINLQLLGGVWILQTLPALVFGLFTRWFHRWALLIGWLAGMLFGTIAAYRVSSPTASHWAAPEDLVFGHHIYIGVTAVVINIVLAAIFSLLFNAFKVPVGTDETLWPQYTADPEAAPAPVPAGIGASATEATEATEETGATGATGATGPAGGAGTTGPRGSHRKR